MQTSVFPYLDCYRSFYSTKQHLTNCRHRAKCVKKTDGKAAKRKSGDCSQTEGGENGRVFGTEPKEVLQMEDTGRVEGEVPTKETVPELCFTFAESSLQLLSTGGRKKVENTIPQSSDGSTDAGELCRRTKRTGECENISDDNTNTALAREGFTKQQKSESSLAVCGAVLYKKDTLPVSR